MESALHKAAVLGDGQMGLICAWILADAAPATPQSSPRPGRVCLWGHDEQDVAELASSRSSPRLPGFWLPERVEVEADLSAALAEAELVVCAVPTQFIRRVFEGARGAIGADVPILSVAKGVELNTLLSPTEAILDSLGELGPAADGAGFSERRRTSSGRGVAALSGPTIARELALGLPATMVAASADAELAERAQRLVSTQFLRVYTHQDIVGVELAGAVKNVVAIAAGVIDGLDAGCNAKSALLARGLAEIARLGQALGAERDTFFGVAGVGDLATSCFSPHGRNRSCGEALGRGKRLDEHLASTQSVVEGVETARAVVALAEKTGVDMPIAVAVHAVLHEGMAPIDAIERLMARPLKEERVG